MPRSIRECRCTSAPVLVQTNAYTVLSSTLPGQAAHGTTSKSTTSARCTGAGYSCCYEDKNLNTVPQGSIRFATSGNGGAKWYGGVEPPPFEILSGFTSYRVGADSMKVVFHAHTHTTARCSTRPHRSCRALRLRSRPPRRAAQPRL